MAPYIEAQRVQNLKRVTLEDTVKMMKQKQLLMTEKIAKNQARIRETLPSAKSSNIVVMKNEQQKDELALCIYNPSYHIKKQDADMYLVPVDSFEEVVSKTSNKKQLCIEVVLNLSTIKTSRISVADLIEWQSCGGENSISSKLVKLGEIAIFRKIKKLYATNNDNITLLQLENLATFKLILG